MSLWNHSSIDFVIYETCNFATKLVPGLRNLPYSERLLALKLDSLEFRRKRESLIHIYKISHNPFLRKSLLSFRSRPGTRGHSCVLASERCHAPSRRNFLTNRVRLAWHDLPPGSVESPTLNHFKNSIRCMPGSWRCALQGGLRLFGHSSRQVYAYIFCLYFLGAERQFLLRASTCLSNGVAILNEPYYMSHIIAEHPRFFEHLEW